MRTLKSLLFAAAVTIAYVIFVRPWQLRWGATDDEVERPMPGDDIVKAPAFVGTRAVTIRARPEHIYPWILQIGVTPRAGWYSYDLIDNLAKPSAEVILPELQNPQRGDLIPMSPDGKQGMYVRDFVRDAWMLWANSAEDSSWAWGLYPVSENETRLVTRLRLKYHLLEAAVLFDIIAEFTDIIMMRKCMLGIKQRAERLAQQTVA